MSRIEDRGWRNNLIEDSEETSTRRYQRSRSARHPKRAVQHSTGIRCIQYLTLARLEVVPVPVYDLHVDEILGQKFFRRLADIPGEGLRPMIGGGLREDNVISFPANTCTDVQR